MHVACVHSVPLHKGSSGFIKGPFTKHIFAGKNVKRRAVEQKKMEGLEMRFLKVKKPDSLAQKKNWNAAQWNAKMHCV